MSPAPIYDYCHAALAVEGFLYCQYCIDLKRHLERECAATQAGLDRWGAL